ncbi:MAG: SPOR domain-containing protein, partial [Comamonas sp.]
ADKSDKADKTEHASKTSRSERAKVKARDKATADKSSEKSGDKASSKTDKASKADKADKPEAKRAATAGKTALQPGKYYLNSGIYAQADNAQRVTRRLRDAGQPVFTQSLESSKGEVTRIRVGPFDSRAQAEAAASKVQGLKLEAQVFRHAPN